MEKMSLGKKNSGHNNNNQHLSTELLCENGGKDGHWAQTAALLSHGNGSSGKPMCERRVENRRQNQRNRANNIFDTAFKVFYFWHFYLNYVDSKSSY